MGVNMGRAVSQVMRLARALFVPDRGDTLAGPHPPATGGRRMFRRIVVIGFSTLALLAAGVGVYALWVGDSQPASREEPVAPKPI